MDLDRPTNHLLLERLLRAKNLSGSLNMETDKLSMMKTFSYKWAIKYISLDSIFTLWGLLVVDLFATEDNRKTTRFCSWAGIGQGSLGDTFQISLQGGLYYAFPPFPLLIRLIEKEQI